MESVLPLLIWGGLLFLMMRFGRGSHLFGHGHGAKNKKGASAEGHGGGCGTSGGTRPRATDGAERLTWEAPEKDVDPVCGTTVSTDKAKPSVFGGEVYYFCSRECREVFEAAPDLYLSKDRSPSAKQLEHSHG